MGDTVSQSRREDLLLRGTLFAFFVSGAASQPLGSFIPFLRESYGFSYDLSGVLLSCQSMGNLAAVLLAGILPAYLGRRRSVLLPLRGLDEETLYRSSETGEVRSGAGWMYGGMVMPCMTGDSTGKLIVLEAV